MSNDQAQAAGIPACEAKITKLVDASQLLEILWDEESRPSLRWLRDRQAERAIPYVKVGARVWFDPVEVRQCLKDRWTVGKLSKPR